VPLGPAAGRLIVGFRATSSNTVVQTIHSQTRGTTVKIGRPAPTPAISPHSRSEWG